ncbi:NAD(P)H-dependent oxidoreductase [Rhodovibrio sodomensis]|uniref:NAD(P)H-dependent oxidoreductase n=1 Tax=Rhodovibrio sodomensis TaxID=1088 RepID=UPI0019058C4F
MSVRILALAGSARRDSVNKKVLQAAVAGAQDAGADVTAIDLADYPMPLYNGDLEASDGLPDTAHKLKALFREHHGLLLACPEYNGSITPLLKNTIDWVTRPADSDEPTLAAFDGKTAGLVAASPGGLGGLRGLAHVRQILSGIRVHVIPQQHALARAGEAFDADGRLSDPAADAAVKGIGRALAQTTARLHA